MKAAFFLILFAAVVGQFQGLAVVLQDRQSTGICGFAAEGRTTGGAGGTVTRVSTLDALTSAVAGDAPKTVILTASLSYSKSGNTVVHIGPNTSLLGVNGSITLKDIGLCVLNTRNVIIQNLKIQKVCGGDAIRILNSTMVWVDHVDLSSERGPDKDYYDGLLDITHGCTFITISWSKFSAHWKASLVGHDNNNCNEDSNITVTFHHNYWTNINSRMPSFRCGQGHIFNSYFENSGNGIEARVGARLLIENNVFRNVEKPVFTDRGYTYLVGNDIDGKSSTAQVDNIINKPSYNYSLDATSSVQKIVTSYAGANLSF